jgi:uncharacterized protein (DUF427 family)
MPANTKPEKPGSGQESVWDYPRPPRVEPTDKRVRVVFNGVTIADTINALRVLETSHPPSYYIPMADVRMEFLKATPRQTFCEFKGKASYFTLEVDDKAVQHGVWHYPNPTPNFTALKAHIALYPGKMDACYVGNEQVQAQEGDFYGGWITSDIVGPFKGGPGTLFW